MSSADAHQKPEVLSLRRTGRLASFSSAAGSRCSPTIPSQIRLFPDSSFLAQTVLTCRLAADLWPGQIEVRLSYDVGTVATTAKSPFRFSWISQLEQN